MKLRHFIFPVWKPSFILGPLTPKGREMSCTPDLGKTMTAPLRRLLWFLFEISFRLVILCRNSIYSSLSTTSPNLHNGSIYGFHVFLLFG
jgi:hypothetical protein